MSTPAPPSLVAAFTFGGTPGVDYTLIPVPSQTGVSPELASFTTGFPVATRTPRSNGGIPPRGLDMNGILFMISAHTAWLAAGGQYTFNPDVVAVYGGYAIGAVIRSAANPAVFFYNTLSDNGNDPDAVQTGWLKFSPVAAPTGRVVDTPPAGPSDDWPVATTTGFLDFNPTAGNATISGLTAGADGQLLMVTNIHPANSLTLLSFGGGSLPANRLRMPADITLLQYSTVTLRYSSGAGLWVVQL